ncbi:NAD kinase [Bacillus solimangrovi]|uniref:NAD kinase n=1 Tax=Bacillus solimangrovi TaxID=1305675 RepID=A0A1E5LCL2_9BACI|nr:NAD kinase [Bacillus solimangrovi]OEH91816.1 NAD kinase [Bacillus solimangrovi]
MPDRKNIFFYYEKHKYNSKVDVLKKLATEQDFIVVEKSTDANIIASIGGDNTFLQAVRKTGFRQDCLYAGISVNNKNYFYCDFDISDTDKLIETMKNEQFEIRRYPTINVTIDNETSFHCLNELSVRSSIIKTFVLEVHIDDLHFETFRGDGLIVSTPTGSTAYNKSVNGSVVDPMLPSIQVSELASLNNNRYRTLGSSFILSGKRKLTLEILQDGNDYPVIGLDNEALSIQNVKRIDIELNDTIIKTIKLKDNSFWHKVQRTFL